MFGQGKLISREGMPNGIGFLWMGLWDEGKGNSGTFKSLDILSHSPQL